MGFFKWRSIALVSSLYILLAILLLSLAYPEPAFRGFVAPSGFRVILYNGDSSVAVLSSENSTLIQWSGRVYSLPFPTRSACYDGLRVFLTVDGGLFIVDSRGAYTLVGFSLNASLAGVICGRVSYAILASNGSPLLVDLDGGTGFKLSGFPLKGSVSSLQVNGDVYLASGNRVAFIEGGKVAVYELPEAALIRGLALPHDGLVAYGSWGDMGLVYRFSTGEAILISVPGRVTSVEAVSCSSYWCTTIVRPYGDWLVLVELNNWRYVSHARIATIKPFIYHSAGVTGRAWISGELVDLGVVALEVSSTREAVVGFNETHAVAWTEGYVTPAPRISRIKIYPLTGGGGVEAASVKLLEEGGSLKPNGYTFKTVEPRVDRLSTLITLAVAALPALVYFYSSVVRGSRD